MLLTTYELVSKHLGELRRLSWAALVVDEAHRLKSASSRLFQDLVRVDADHRVLLTGTPLQNSLEELFFLMNFLEPAKFGSVDAFKAAYASLDDKDKVGDDARARGAGTWLVSSASHARRMLVSACMLPGGLAHGRLRPLSSCCGQVGELHRQLQPHMLRRLKKDVLKQLPPKMEQIVRLELSDEQRELYKAILSRNYEALVGEAGRSCDGLP